MSKSEKMQGKQVSEEEAATGLGFSNVIEFRRWQTEQGYRISELEHEVRQAKNDASNFRWHGRRMEVMLEKAEEFLKKLDPAHPEHAAADLLLAIGVVTGKSVDWGHVVDHWFKDIQP